MHPIVLGNGELQIDINTRGLVERFSFPNGGVEHMAQADTRHHVGVWVDGQISWLSLHAHDWEVTTKYPYRALIATTKATNQKLGIMLELSDTVDTDAAIFLRNIHVVNLKNDAREVRLFMHQAFTMDDLQTAADTIQYRPEQHALLQYRGNRAFVIGGRSEAAPEFDQFSVGHFGGPGQEGTFRDADDGELSMNRSAVGRVDSTLRFSLELPAHDSRHVQYWVAAGNTHAEAFRAHQLVRQQSVHGRIQHTLKAWHEWIQPVSTVAERIDEAFRPSFIKSLLYIKARIGKNGAITSPAQLPGAHLAYCRPYEAAVSLWPLIRLGYTEEPRAFFRFCESALSPDGSLHAVLQADGAPGAQLHHQVDVPRHINEAAIVLFMFAQFQQAHPESDVLQEFYAPLVKRLARFLTATIDATTTLPKPATTLGSDDYVSSSHTTAVVYVALQAASELAELARDADNAVAWRLAAVDVHAAAQKAFYRTDAGFITKTASGTPELDPAGVFGSFMFGLFAADGPEIARSVEAIAARSAERHTLGVSFGGEAYSTVATLWLAQYYVEQGSVDRARDILTWLYMMASDTGMLPSEIYEEDAVPRTQADLSVWAHAEYISTLLDIIAQPKAE